MLRIADVDVPVLVGPQGLDEARALLRGLGPASAQPAGLRKHAVDGGHEERGDRRTNGGERPLKKSQWGTLNGSWVLKCCRHNELRTYNRSVPMRSQCGTRQLGADSTGRSLQFSWSAPGAASSTSTAAPGNWSATRTLENRGSLFNSGPSMPRGAVRALDSGGAGALWLVAQAEH